MEICILSLCSGHSDKVNYLITMQVNMYSAHVPSVYIYNLIGACFAHHVPKAGPIMRFSAVSVLIGNVIPFHLGESCSTLDVVVICFRTWLFCSVGNTKTLLLSEQLVA